jgi:hypothetical protein
VEKIDGLHLGDTARVSQLLGLKLVMVLPGFKEILQEDAIRDANFGPYFELWCV